MFFNLLKTIMHFFEFYCYYCLVKDYVFKEVLMQGHLSNGLYAFSPSTMHFSQPISLLLQHQYNHSLQFHFIHPCHLFSILIQHVILFFLFHIQIFICGTTGLVNLQQKLLKMNYLSMQSFKT